MNTLSDENEKIEESFEEEEEQEQDTSNAVLSKAEKIAERIEQANKKFEENLQRQETLHAKRIIAGRARAGSKKISPEEKELAETKKWLKGTGFEDMLNAE